VADGIKLFFKEEFTPAGADKVLFFAAPAVAVVTAFLAVAVVPWGGSVTIAGREIALQIADLEVGVLYLFAIASLGVYGIVLAGWAANNKYGLLGGLRSSAQMFSYELALGMSWVTLIMAAGSFRIGDLVEQQAGSWGFLHWNAVVQFPAFVIYVIAATAEANRTPFDLPEAEAELVAGFHTEYGSMKFALIQMAEYINMITISALCANLFLGGGLSPIPAAVPILGSASPLWFLIKLLAVLFFFIWLRGTLPRFRYDQLMFFGWKVLIPIVTLWIIIAAVLMKVFQ
jgi:NADH-quinone oxidoreductase subunit H